jgi:hypothetical protein
MNQIVAAGPFLQVFLEEVIRIFIYSKLLNQSNLNIMVKSFIDYKYLIENNNNNNNICFFIGKYKSQEKLVNEIFNYRQQNFKNLTSRFLLLSGFFSYNCIAVKNTYHNLKKIYNIDLYGFENLNEELGWANIVDNYNIDTNVLSKYKFSLQFHFIFYFTNFFFESIIKLF